MKLLIVSQYFWPESFIINALTQTLAAQGHDITVATGKPNYPDGCVFAGYNAAGVLRETFSESVDVMRVPLRPRGAGGARNLLLNYFSFVWSGLRLFPGLLRGKEFDAILVFMPSPITTAIPAIALKWLKKAHLAIWVQDLWPESAAATGFVRHTWLLRVIGWFVRAIYAVADTLLVQSRAFQEPVARYARADKVVYYPNSVEAPDPTLPEEPLPAKLVELLESSFCVVFAGNIGTAQAVETLIGAAERLKNRLDCKLVLVGSGSMFEWAKAKKSELKLDNLVLTGRFPMSAMPAIYRRAGALLVSLKDEEIFAHTIPSKVQAYLAAGKPIIAALNGEGARVVLEAGAGLTCPAEDAEALASRVRELHSMPPQERARMGEAGYAYFLEHFEMHRQAARLVEILEQRIRGREH